MIHFRIRVDVENLRSRLSRLSGRMVAEAEAVAWLAQRGIVRSIPSGEFLSTDEAMEFLEPWEILQRLPLISLPPRSLEHAANRP